MEDGRKFRGLKYGGAESFRNTQHTINIILESLGKI